MTINNTDRATRVFLHRLC